MIVLLTLKIIESFEMMIESKKLDEELKYAREKLEESLKEIIEGTKEEEEEEIEVL